MIGCMLFSISAIVIVKNDNFTEDNLNDVGLCVATCVSTRSPVAYGYVHIFDKMASCVIHYFGLAKHWSMANQLAIGWFHLISLHDQCLVEKMGPLVLPFLLSLLLYLLQ